jgi:hypothetical protein
MVKADFRRHKLRQEQQFSFCQVGRARHSVRAGARPPASERRARSDAPYPATHFHTENCCVRSARAWIAYGPLMPL